MKTNYILEGSVLDRLKDIEDESIQCVVTSPPYWGLRDYGEDDQLGLEETPGEFVDNLVKVFREVKRVLRKDGTVWLNLGDSYMSSGYGMSESNDPKNNKTKNMNKRDKKECKYCKKKYLATKNQKFCSKQCAGVDNTPRIKKGILKPKDLAGIPWRVALALQSDGWYLRQDIIWHKPNPMPESVQDRCTKSHEYIFLLTKSAKYFYDVDALREKSTTGEHTRNRASNFKKNSQIDGRYVGGGRKEIIEYDGTRNKRSVWTIDKYGSVDNESKHRQGMHKNRGQSVVVERPNLPNQKEFVDFIRDKTNAKNLSEDSGIKLSKVEHWFRYDESGFAYPTIEDRSTIREYLDDWSEGFKDIDDKMTYLEHHLDTIDSNPKGRNKRSVWTITTKPYKEAHFAKFPPELPELCIKAGCPEKVCKKCRNPVIKESFRENKLNVGYGNQHTPSGTHKKIGGKYQKFIEENPKKVIEKPTCDCDVGFEGGIVLDPFFGSGTTGWIAQRLGRKWIGVELNPEYIKIAEKRFMQLELF